MDQFFDRQRGVDLPEGCKDLIDVLNLARAAAPPQMEPPKGLADVESYVSQFLASAARFRCLWIYCDVTLLGLFFGKHGLRALVLVDAAREQRVRTIFAEAGISPIQDDPLSNNARGLVYALPIISGLDQFIRDLLVHGLGVTQDTTLEFRFHEKDTPKTGGLP